VQNEKRKRVTGSKSNMKKRRRQPITIQTKEENYD
jgi:hypothetical protein